MPHFECGAFDHSATSPCKIVIGSADSMVGRLVQAASVKKSAPDALKAQSAGGSVVGAA